jgi:3-hydroxyisobutyrate dehydrogenase-like beta-hydroxyacid dehydrogenase
VYDATTGRPGDAVEIADALSAAGVVYSDSTVSGNSEVAERGELVVMVGGSKDAYQRGVPIFEAIGRSHHHVGPVGSASRMKLIVNHALTVHRMALAEALVVAELADMDLETTLDVLKDSLAYSKAMDVWGDQMVAGDHQHPYSRLRQSHKDARLIVEHGLELGATMDLAQVARAALAEGEETGLAEMDNSSVVEVVRRRAGIGRVR